MTASFQTKEGRCKLSSWLRINLALETSNCHFEMDVFVSPYSGVASYVWLGLKVTTMYTPSDCGH